MKNFTMNLMAGAAALIGGIAHGRIESELRAELSSSGFLKKRLHHNYRIGLAGCSCRTSATTFPQPCLHRAGIVLESGHDTAGRGVFFFSSSALLGAGKR